MVELMEHQENISQDFLKDLTPWSNKIPEIRKVNEKSKNTLPIASPHLMHSSWFTVYVVAMSDVNY